MLKVTLLKSLNVRSGDVPLRFRLQDGRKADIVIDTGKCVEAAELMAFGKDGNVRKGCGSFNASLKSDIDKYLSVMSEVYLALARNGAAVTEEALLAAVEEKAGSKWSDDADADSLVERFRRYLDEEHRCGRFSDKKYRETYVITRKLERYLLVRERSNLRPSQFTLKMVTDFEKFCVDEYLYAANPKYASIYPRDYDGSRWWPKRRLKEEAFRKSLIQFHAFWNDLVAFGEIGKSPYDGYEPWMQEKKRRCYTEVIGDPVSLTMDEFGKLISTPVPERLGDVRNAFILQICTGCRGGEFRHMTLDNIAVSSEGIPYLHYPGMTSKANGRDIEVPLVRIAFDIVMRTRFNFFFGTRNEAYNRSIQELLRFCGITREVCLYNNRTGVSEMVRICDVMSQGYVHRNHIDLIHDAGNLLGVRMTAGDIQLEDRFRLLNIALGQKPYKVDANLNIMEGAPFALKDPLIYKEQPDKLPGGRTNPYVLSELAPADAGCGNVLSLRYAPDLENARPVLACGPFMRFMESLEDDHRLWIQYGIMLLKILGGFNVTFIKDCKDTVFALWSAPRGFSYTIYFYLNAGTIVLLDGCLSGKYRRMKAQKEKSANAGGLRWKHVIGEVNAIDYDAILDEVFGARGTSRREINEMQACCRYVSQSLRQARIDKGLSQQDVFSQWGFKADCGNLAHAENGTRVLPFKYLARLLSVLGYKAVAVRPGLDGWNAISRTTTLDKMQKDAGVAGSDLPLIMSNTVSE